MSRFDGRTCLPARGSTSSSSCRSSAARCSSPIRCRRSSSRARARRWRSGRRSRRTIPLDELAADAVPEARHLGRAQRGLRRGLRRSRGATRRRARGAAGRRAFAVARAGLQRRARLVRRARGVIETERLLIRPPTEDERAAMLALWRDPRTNAFRRDVSDEQMRAWVESVRGASGSARPASSSATAASSSTGTSASGSWRTASAATAGAAVTRPRPRARACGTASTSSASRRSWPTSIRRTVAVGARAREVRLRRAPASSTTGGLFYARHAVFRSCSRRRMIGFASLTISSR